jgi:hypothetical protein
MDTKRAEAMTHARLEVVEAFASCLPPLLNYARRRLRFHMGTVDRHRQPVRRAAQHGTWTETEALGHGRKICAIVAASIRSFVADRS